MSYSRFYSFPLRLFNHSKKQKQQKNIQITKNTQKNIFFLNKPWLNQVILFPFYFFNQTLSQSNSILSHFLLT